MEEEGSVKKEVANAAILSGDKTDKTTEFGKILHPQQSELILLEIPPSDWYADKIAANPWTMWCISFLAMLSFAMLGIVLAISKKNTHGYVGGASEGFEARGTTLSNGFIAGMHVINQECLGHLSGSSAGVGSTFYSANFNFEELGGANIRYTDPANCYPGYLGVNGGDDSERRRLTLPAATESESESESAVSVPGRATCTTPFPETTWEPTSTHYDTVSMRDEVRIRRENHARARALTFGDFGYKYDPALVSEQNWEVPLNSKRGMSLVFEADAGKSLWNLDAIKGICGVDTAIRTTMPGWSTVCEPYGGVTPATCQPSRSLGNYIAALSGAASCASLTQVDLDNVMETLKTCRPAYDDSTLKPNCWDWSASAGAYVAKYNSGTSYPTCNLAPSLQVKCAKYNAVFDIFSSLVQKDWLKNNSDAPLAEVQLITFNKYAEIYDKVLRTGWTETVEPMLGKNYGGATFVAGTAYPRFRSWLFNTEIAADPKGVILIFVVVYFLILFHSGSFWITSCAFFQIFMAFFWGYSFYQIFMWNTFFPFLNLISVFLIIGIGSDDVFVYVDAFKQSFTLLPRHCPLANRLAWVMRRAGGAMFVTTFTTSVSFLANIASPITALKGFGLFTSLVILADYLLMILFLPATVALYYTTFSIPAGKHQMKLQRNPDWQLTNLLCCPMSVTYEECGEQAIEGGDINRDNTKPQIEMTKISSSVTVEIMNRSSDAPSKEDSDLFLNDIKHARTDECKCLNCCCCVSRLDIDYCSIPTEVDPKTQNIKARWAEDFFEFKFAPFVLHKYLKFCLIAGILATTVYMSFSAVKLSKPDSDYMQFLDAGHYLEKYDGHYINMFDINRGENRLFSYQIFFGLADIDNGDFMNPWSRGTPEYNRLDISSPAAQQYLYDLCITFAGWEQTPPVSSYYGKSTCGIRWFRDWMESPCGTTTNTAGISANMYVVQPQRSSCCGKAVGDFPYASSEFNTCLHSFSNYWAAQRKNHGFFYDMNGTLKVISITAPTLTKFTYVFGISNKFYLSLLKIWNSLPAAPVGTGLEYGFITSALGFYALQEAIAEGAINSAVLSTIFALIVLIILSRTVLASILSGMHIAACVVTVTGIAVKLGWKLNVMESVIFSLSVGLCCDFAAHLSHAFNQVIEEHVTDKKVPLRFPRSIAELIEHMDLSNIKSVIAIRELSVPIYMGFLSTFGAGIILLSGNLFFFQQFGTFLATIMACSLLTAYCFLMPMLSSIGWVDRLISHTLSGWFEQFKAKYYRSTDRVNSVYREDGEDEQKPNVPCKQSADHAYNVVIPATETKNESL